MAAVSSRKGGLGDHDGGNGRRNRNGSFFVRDYSAPELPIDNIGTPNYKGDDDGGKRGGNDIDSVFKYSGNDVVVPHEGMDGAGGAANRLQTTNTDQLVINTKLLIMVYAR